MTPYPAYSPSPEEIEAVKYCQAQGAPADVQYMDIGSAATSAASADYKEIWFTSANETRYKADAKSLTAAPYASVNEMGGETLQMLRGQVNGDPPLAAPP